MFCQAGTGRHLDTHIAPQHVAVMLRILCFLPLLMSAAASSLNDRDQTLPAINVKYDFPSSSTIASAKEKLDIVNRDAVFSKRVQQVQLKTEDISRALQEFAREVRGQLDAVVSVVRPVANSLESHSEQPSFLQVTGQKQRVAGVTLNDVESLAQDAESLSELYSSNAQGLPTLKDEQRSILAGNVEALSAIHAELLHEKHAFEAAESLSHCASCERNHHQLCPDGWSEVAGGYCTGPSEYDGPCMAFADFGSSSAKDKTEYERACLVCWPCQ